MARLKVDWSRKNTTDVDPTVRRFERWLNENGYREACVETYVGAVRKLMRGVPRTQLYRAKRLNGCLNSHLARS